jgi:hypothetical protein
MYYFASDREPLSLDKIAHWLQEALVDCEIECEVEGEVSEQAQELLNLQKWKNILLSIEEGSPVVEIERWDKGDQGFSEVLADTVRDLLDNEKPLYPASAVSWLCRYLETINTIYCFTPSTCFNDEGGIPIFNEVWQGLKSLHTGIVLCPEEGFTNESGAQITTSASTVQKGKVRAAVLDESSKSWKEFTLDLNNQEQIHSFKSGSLPRS